MQYPKPVTWTEFLQDHMITLSDMRSRTAERIWLHGPIASIKEDGNLITIERKWTASCKGDGEKWHACDQVTACIFDKEEAKILAVGFGYVITLKSGSMISVFLPDSDGILAASEIEGLDLEKLPVPEAVELP